MADSPVQTLIIDNFQGRLTRYSDGDINSGYANYTTTFGNDPFTSPGNLTWFETPIQIDPTGSVITDLIMASKNRLESGISYVYAIGHTGRFYKIQVNDPTTYNPNYDNPVLLATLAINTPTFKYGASMQFYGATEKVYIGHDKGVTSINFDGTGEAFVGVLATWTQNVPRMSASFAGSLYYTNGTNIAAIDSTATVTTYTKLSPGFPVGTQARDIDVSPDGTYVQIIVSRVPQPDLTVSTQDTSSLSSGDSYRFLWNGTDTGYTSYATFNSYSMGSNLSFGDNTFSMGYDLGGAAIYQNTQKIISLTLSNCPVPQALYSIGNLLGFAAPEQANGVSTGSLLVYGQYDNEIPPGLFRFFRNASVGVTATAATLPASGTNDTSTGTEPWTNPGNITADDSSYASVGDVDGTNITDNRVSLVGSTGLITTANKANSATWTTTESTVSYGGAADLWGATWTPADINDADFGAVLAVNVNGPNAFISNYLKGGTFGFSIPLAATIKGIKLDIKRKLASGFGTTANVNCFKITVYYEDPAAVQNVIQMPTCEVVSNLLYGASNAGYTNNQIGSAKLYFSTNETSTADPNQYNLYKFTTVPTGLGTSIGGVYQTQTQIIGKKVEVKEVRIYGEPWVLNNSFLVEVIGSNGQAIENCSKTFIAGDNLTVGADYAWYTPQGSPTYAIGVRVTNLGSVNNVITKIEVDYAAAGK